MLCIFFVRCGFKDVVPSPAEIARVRRSTLAHKEITSKLAEAVPAESEGISAFNGCRRIFIMRGDFKDDVSSPTESEGISAFNGLHWPPSHSGGDYL